MAHDDDDKRHRKVLVSLALLPLYFHHSYRARLASVDECELVLCGNMARKFLFPHQRVPPLLLDGNNKDEQRASTEVISTMRGKLRSLLMRLLLLLVDAKSHQQRTREEHFAVRNLKPENFKSLTFSIFSRRRRFVHSKEKILASKQK